MSATTVLVSGIKTRLRAMGVSYKQLAPPIRVSDLISPVESSRRFRTAPAKADAL